MKPIIYQTFPRWMTNSVEHCVPNGDMATNGVGKFNDIDDRLLRQLRQLGVTHMWYTGVLEQATTTNFSAWGIAPCHPSVVKGKAGSPYAIRDYYDVSPELAVDVPHRIAEFEALVERTHKAGMKVIIDFVPNHVAREYGSDAAPDGTRDLGADDNRGMFFDPHNNFFYITGEEFAPVDVPLDGYSEMPARATGNDCYHAHPSRNDWYETVKLNYGVDPWNGSEHFNPVPSTWRKMLDILLYWSSKGVDGFRCDMAHMVPVAFWHWCLPQVKQRYRDMIFIAEIYDVALYRNYIFNGYFDYLYDKVTLYDTLCDVLRGRCEASRLTGCWQTVDDIGRHMLHFMENHDEVRVASDALCGDGATALPAVVVSATLTAAPFMLYAGQELGERATDAEGYSGRDGRTTIFDYWSVPTVRRWYNKGRCSAVNLNAGQRELRAFYKRLLNLCNSEAALREGAMFDLMYVNGDTLDARQQFAYLRHHGNETVLVAVNFGSVAARVPVRLPRHAFDHLHLAEGRREAVELLTDRSDIWDLRADHTVTVDLPAHGAVMWKF